MPAALGPRDTTDPAKGLDASRQALTNVRLRSDRGYYRKLVRSATLGTAACANKTLSIARWKLVESFETSSERDESTASTNDDATVTIGRCRDDSGGPTRGHLRT